MKPRSNAPHRQNGFTLLELVIVIVITSVIAVTVALVVRPSVAAYNAVKGRAELIDQADLALRRIVKDVRMAVPNSIRAPTSQCFEVIPASTGGRYRMAPDTANDSPSGCATPTGTCAAPLDTTQSTTQFDSFSTLSPLPVAGDFVVVNNQNGNDVYEGLNRSAITAISTPAVSQGKHRLSINAIQFSQGYDGGRFLVVPNAQKAVFYVCAGTDSGNLDANGDGKGSLYRLKNYGFNATSPTACPSVAGADVLATKVKSCTFVYNPNQGATQQSGFLMMDIEIARNSETAHLVMGAHVSNVP